jgi:hydrophobic/amphiphilic exporter-1 (mainly G- bacteria), HAE1 family
MTETRDWNYRLVRYFLNNTQLTALAFLFLVLAGFFGFRQLRVEGFPAVPVPLVIVSTVLPGAGPETVMETVSIPLEDKLRDVKNVKQVSSTSRDNVSVLILDLETGTDTSTAVADVRSQIASVDLPEGAEIPSVFVPETGGAPYIIAVSGNLPLPELREKAKLLEERLKQIDGIKSVGNISAAQEKIYIDVKPEFLSPEIFSQIEATQVSFPLGRINQNNQQTPVAGAKLAQTFDDLKNLQVNVAPSGQPTRILKLSEIADVYKEIDYNGQVQRVAFHSEHSSAFVVRPALLYEVRLTQGADLLNLDDEVKAAIHDLTEENKPVEFTPVFDQADDSRAQVEEIVEGAVGGKWDIEGPLANLGFVFGGVWLLVIAVLLFLDWRSAIISFTAIPLSFLATFIFLYVFGIQLNTMVLFSIVLVLGLIVDPAIVVLESIKRYVDLGHKGKEGVLHSIGTVGTGIFMSVLTSTIVFIPFGIVSGTFGEIIKYIPLTVVPALLASYFVPMLFLTWFAAKFLKPARHVESVIDENDPSSLWPVAQWFIRINRYILSRVWLQIIVVLAGIVIPIGIAGYLFSSGQIKQVQFSQPDDVEAISISIPLKGTQNDSEIAARAVEAENILKKYSVNIETFFYMSLDGEGTMDAIPVFVQLKPTAERKRTSKNLAAAMSNELVKKFGDDVVVREFGIGPPTMAYPVTVKIFENDLEKIRMASEKIAQELDAYPEVTGVKYDGQNPQQEIKVKLAQDKLAATGLPSAAVYGTLSTVLGERTLFQLEDLDVVARIAPASRPKSVDDLRNLPLFGGSATVGSLGTVEQSNVPSEIKRLNGERYQVVSARVPEEKDVINVQRKIDEWASENASTLGLTPRAFEDRAGLDEFEQSFQELFAAIGLSIILTYIIFVLFFKSFAQPFIILFAVPLMFIGAFPALAIISGGQLGFLETLGVIMVIGIVENVGIFLIDYANRLVAGGMDKKEAIALSSGLRFRPIILTKVTALAGLLPLAIFAPFWRGLAVVVIMGILSSGILSLFTTPVLYHWFTRTKKINPETV